MGLFKQVFKQVFKYINTGMRAFAYVKMCEKTGMSLPEIVMYKECYKAGLNAVGQKFNIYLHKKGVVKPRKPRVKSPQLPSKSSGNLKI